MNKVGLLLGLGVGLMKGGSKTLIVKVRLLSLLVLYLSLRS